MDSGEKTMIIRILMLIMVFAIVTFQVLDRSIIRTLTATKSVESVYVSEPKTKTMVIETQEIVNQESVLKFSKKAVVSIFNYRPGQALEHVSSEKIKSLFITEEYFDKFKKQFIAWSKHEFNVNNISIKEAVASNGELLMTPSPMSSGGVRLWQYKASLPTLDRGVGSSQLTPMFITVKLVYLGASGGIGIYSMTLNS
jgi:hypothetical protein